MTHQNAGDCPLLFVFSYSPCADSQPFTLMTPAGSGSVVRPDAISLSQVGFNETWAAGEKLRDGMRDSCAAAVNERGCSIVHRLIIGATGEISLLGA